MLAQPPKKIDISRLRELVENRLCELGHLEPQQFPLTTREVIKGGRKCGIYFCLHGPRSVKLTAICDFHHQTILYYGSDGVRRERAELPAIDPSVLASAT